MRFMDELRVGELAARWGPDLGIQAPAIVALPKKERRDVPPFLRAQPASALRLGLALGFLAVLLALLLVLGLLRRRRGRRSGGRGRGSRRSLRCGGKRRTGESSDHQNCNQLFHVTTS